MSTNNERLPDSLREFIRTWNGGPPDGMTLENYEAEIMRRCADHAEDRGRGETAQQVLIHYLVALQQVLEESEGDEA